MTSNSPAYKLLLKVLNENHLDVVVNPTGTDKGSIHSYLKHIYAPILDLMGWKDKLRILEIGVFRGGSLAMWKLAMPNSEIFAIDIDTSNIQNEIALKLINQGEVVVIEGNPYLDESLIPQYGKYDIIIDDGPHTIDSQITALSFVQHLNENGILIIEDINIRDPKLMSLISKVNSLSPDQTGIINMVLKKGRFDDAVIIVTKNSTLLEWLRAEKKRCSNRHIERKFFRYAVLAVAPFSLLRAKILRRLIQKSF